MRRSTTIIVVLILTVLVTAWPVAASGAFLWSHNEHNEEVRTVAITDDGLVVSGSNDERVVVWDPDTDTVESEHDTHTDNVWQVRELPNGNIASAGDDERVVVWDPDTDNVEAEHTDHTSSARALDVLDEDTIVSGDRDGNVVVWDLDADTTTTYDHHDDSIWYLTVTDDGNVASAGDDGEVFVWDPDTDTIVAEHDEHGSEPVRTVHETDDGLIVTGDFSGKVVGWDPDTDTVEFEFTAHNGVTSVIETGGGLIVTAGLDDNIQAWNPDAEAVVWTHDEHTDVPIEVVETGGGDIVSGGNDNRVVGWEYTHDVTVSNPTPSSGAHESPTTLSVDIEAYEWADDLEVIFLDGDGSEIGTDTLTDNGTASVDWDWTHEDTEDGTLEWTAVASDGSTTTTFNAETHDPILSNPDPADDEDVTGLTVELSIDIEDADFDENRGDEVTIDWQVNGNNYDTTVHTENETASISIDSEDISIGENTWYVEAEDSYGNTDRAPDTGEYSFNTPSNVTFRYEDNASKIVTGADATATFYSEDGTTIVERTDEDGDGNISLSGLPNAEFVVTVDADGYHDRRVFISSIFEQQNIYLLNETEHPNPVSNTFIYEDRTGNFPSDETALKVQRGVDIEGDDEFEWQTVAGDFWGAAGEFPFTGEHQARYRLVIENTETDRQRIVGTHIPTEDGTKNIIVGRIEWEAEDGTGRFFDASLRTEDNEIIFRYNDPQETTTDLNVTIHEPGNTSNVIYQEVHTDTYGDLEVVVPITDNQSEESWIVAYTAQHDTDGEISGQTAVGGSPFPLPVDPWLLGTLCWVMLTFVATLYGPRTVTLGAWALVIMAGILMLFQWVDIPIASFLVAAGIAAGATFYREATP